MYIHTHTLYINKYINTNIWVITSDTSSYRFQTSTVRLKQKQEEIIKSSQKILQLFLDGNI